jgi:hypothetical protein
MIDFIFYPKIITPPQRVKPGSCAIPVPRKRFKLAIFRAPQKTIILMVETAAIQPTGNLAALIGPPERQSLTPSRTPPVSKPNTPTPEMTPQPSLGQ